MEDLLVPIIAWGDLAYKDICKTVNKIVHTAKAVSYGLYYTANKWHFEDKIAKNGLHPSHQDVVTGESGWILLDKSESVFHDNGVGEPEEKYIKDDGREAVFDGDTHQPVNDPRYMATYNYVSPYVISSTNASITDYGLMVTTRLGHLVFDLFPYFLTLRSNTREQFEANFTRIIIW